MRSLSQSLQVWISPRPAKSSKRISSQNKKTSSCLAKGNRVPQVNDSPLDIHQSFIPADMLTTTTIGSNEGHGEKDYFNFSPSSNQGGTLTPASQTHVSVYSLEHKQSFQDASPISAGPGASSDEDRDYRDAIQQWDHEQAIERKPSLPVISDIKAKICSPLPRLPVRETSIARRRSADKRGGKQRLSHKLHAPLGKKQGLRHNVSQHPETSSITRTDDKLEVGHTGRGVPTPSCAWPTPKSSVKAPSIQSRGSTVRPEALPETTTMSVQPQIQTSDDSHVPTSERPPDSPINAVMTSACRVEIKRVPSKRVHLHNTEDRPPHLRIGTDVSPGHRIVSSAATPVGFDASNPYSDTSVNEPASRVDSRRRSNSLPSDLIRELDYSTHQPKEQDPGLLRVETCFDPHHASPDFPSPFHSPSTSPQHYLTDSPLDDTSRSILIHPPPPPSSDHDELTHTGRAEPYGTSQTRSDLAPSTAGIEVLPDPYDPWPMLETVPISLSPTAIAQDIPDETLAAMIQGIGTFHQRVLTRLEFQILVEAAESLLKLVHTLTRKHASEIRRRRRAILFLDERTRQGDLKSSLKVVKVLSRMTEAVDRDQQRLFVAQDQFRQVEQLLARHRQEILHVALQRCTENALESEKRRDQTTMHEPDEKVDVATTHRETGQVSTLEPMPLPPKAQSPAASVELGPSIPTHTDFVQEPIETLASSSYPSRPPPPPPPPPPTSARQSVRMSAQFYRKSLQKALARNPSVRSQTARPISSASGLSCVDDWMAYHFPLPPPVNDHASPPSPPRTSVTERDAGDPACGQDDQDDSCGLGTNQGIDSVPVHRSTDQPEPSLEGRQRPRVASIEVLVYDSDHSDHSSHNKPGVLSTKTARLPFFGRRKSDVGLNHHHQAGGGGCSMVAALKPRASVSSLITMRSDGSLARFDGERGKATSGSSRSSGLIRGSEQVEHLYTGILALCSIRGVREWESEEIV